jgi:hypothetical protein
VTVAILSLLLASALAAHGGKDEPEPEFVPDPAAGGELELRGHTWVAETADYTVDLQQIDHRQRLAYIKHTTGLGTDPFVGPPEKDRRFISFVVRVENRGEGSLSFNPNNSVLRTNRSSGIQTPMTLYDLSFAYRLVDSELPPAYERVGAALLENPRILRPGESTSGLLIYRAAHRKTKTYHVQLELTLPSGDVASFLAPYRRADTVKSPTKKDEPA